ncbi:MAG TPA: hypothetical protein VED20_02835 [Streptosporangiaceae bacterium]|nr:hypothetical protein [Streptosporangiaceae bacterium]
MSSNRTASGVSEPTRIKPRCAAQAQGRHAGRPAADNDDLLAIACAHRERGESVTATARHLRVGRSALDRALDLEHDTAAWPATGGVLGTVPGVGGQQSGPG